MAISVFVDGSEGTTGLQIRELLQRRGDVSIIPIEPALRRDRSERKRLMNMADTVILCLPDDASREAVSLINNPDTCVIDTSSAFRTDASWEYGLPELENGQRNSIRNSKRISNPGCHALAFILIVRPLMNARLLPADYPVSATSFTGYSGGGSKMIASYEASGAGLPLTPQPYALDLDHKHLPEMVCYSGLHMPPVFIPAIGSFYRGLSVWIPLRVDGVTPDKLFSVYRQYYDKEPFIRVHVPDEHGVKPDYFFDVEGSNDTNRVDLMILGNEARQCIVARIDNLWKGAAGSAVQNMNIHMGIDETCGLV